MALLRAFLSSPVALYGLFGTLALLFGCTSLHPVQGEPDQVQPVQRPEQPKQSERISPVSKPPQDSPPSEPRLDPPPAFVPRKKGAPGKPYRIRGKTYYPLLSARGYEERGIASWYGPSLHGRLTSCGDTFDMHQLSAAHRLLPMHTRVKVTNLENGKSVAVTINDRGPFIPGRILDLSYAAAKRLGIADKGLARVLIRSSGQVEGQRNNDIIGDFYVHIGSFEEEADARYLLEDMKSIRYKPWMIKVIRSARDGEIRWRVEVGPYRSMSSANKAHSRIHKDYPSAFVVAPE